MREVVDGATFIHQSLKNQAAIMAVLIDLYTPKVCESTNVSKTQERAHMNCVLSSNYQKTKELLDLLDEGEF